MALPETPLDRRTLLAGAAWSVPVIAVAVGAPAAAASTTIDVDFAVAYIELRTESVVAGVIAITNTGATATADTVTLRLSGLAAPSAHYYSTSFEPNLLGEVDKGDAQHTRVPTINSAFVPSFTEGDTTLTLIGNNVPLPRGVVYVAVYFDWEADNPEVDGFVIAGSFEIVIGGTVVASTDDELELGQPS
jgi:hypothetical protein